MFYGLIGPSWAALHHLVAFRLLGGLHSAGGLAAAGMTEMVTHPPGLPFIRFLIIQ